MKGKGFFLWIVPEIAKGDPAGLAAILKTAGIRRIEVKVANGNARYRAPVVPYPTWGENLKPEWLASLRCLWDGEVWGWGFNYGYDPEGEGAVGADQAERLGLDGYIFDAESDFERQPDAPGRARRMVRAFKAKSAKPTAWCSWALFDSPYGSGGPWHPKAVAREAMTLCDFGMPMVYWPNSTPYMACFWLEKALAQWRALTSKPIIPVGRAYIGDGGTATPEGVTTFGEQTRKLGLPSESWWSLSHAIRLPAVWAALCALSPIGEAGQPGQPAPIEEWRRALTVWARGQGYGGPD